MLQEYIVRPGKVYLIIGIGIIALCSILGICILMDEGARFVAVYILMYLFLFSVFGLAMLIFYFRKKIILKEDEFIIHPVIGKAKKWSYSQVSLVRIYSNQGLSRPIALFVGQKKIVQIVFAYSGYFAFEQIFDEKCSDVMEYC